MSPANIAFTNDPPLIGIGDFKSASPYRVWNMATGQPVAAIPLEGAVSSAAFAPDGKSVYIGLASKRLRQYRLADAAIMSEVQTAVSPIVISPNGNRYIGFVTDANDIGSMVLADLGKGHTLEVVNPAANINNKAYFSTDGKTFAYVVNREKCAAAKGLDTDEAIKWLERQGIDSQLASTSQDLRDYQERWCVYSFLICSPPRVPTT